MNGWREVARVLLQEWCLDTCVYDRGTSADEQRLDALWEELDRAIENDNAELATALLALHRNKTMHAA